MSNAKRRHRRRRRVAKHVRGVLLGAVRKHRGKHLGSALDEMFAGLGETDELHRLIMEKWGHLF